MAKKKTIRRVNPMGLMPLGTYSAFTIAEHVAGQILDEPRRFHMGAFYYLLRGRRAQISQPFKETPPACGTIACVAGWVGLNLRMKTVNVHSMVIAAWLTGDTTGLTEPTQDFRRLFDTAQSYAHEPGTKAYAREFVRRFYGLMEKHGPLLRARQITITRNGPIETPRP